MYVPYREIINTLSLPQRFFFKRGSAVVKLLWDLSYILQLHVARHWEFHWYLRHYRPEGRAVASQV